MLFFHIREHLILRFDDRILHGQMDNLYFVFKSAKVQLCYKVSVVTPKSLKLYALYYLSLLVIANILFIIKYFL